MSDVRSVHFGDNDASSKRSKKQHQHHQHRGGSSSPHHRSPLGGNDTSSAHWSSPTLDLSYRLRHRPASPTDSLRYAYTPRKHHHHKVIAAAATQVSSSGGGGGVPADGHSPSHNGGRRLSKLQSDEMRVQQILKGTYQHPISASSESSSARQRIRSASPTSPNRRVNFANGVGDGPPPPPLGVLDKQASIVKPTPFRQAMMKTLTPGNMQIEFLRNLWEQDDRDKEAHTITKLLEAAEQRKKRIREDRRRRRAIIAKVKAHNNPEGGGGSGGGSMTLYSESISTDVSDSTDDDGDRAGGMTSTQQLLQLFKNKAAHRHEQVSKKLSAGGVGSGGGVGGGSSAGGGGLTGLNAFLLDRGGSFTGAKDSINVSRIETIAADREARLARDRYGEKWSLYHLKENNSGNNANNSGHRMSSSTGSFSNGVVGGGLGFMDEDGRVSNSHMMKWADDYLSSTFDGGGGDGQDLMASFIGGVGEGRRGPKTPRRTAPLTPSELQHLYKTPTAATNTDGTPSFKLSPSSAKTRTTTTTTTATPTAAANTAMRVGSDESRRSYGGGSTGAGAGEGGGSRRRLLNTTNTTTEQYPGIPFVTIGTTNSSANSTPGALRPASSSSRLHHQHNNSNRSHQVTAGEVVAATLNAVRPRGSTTTLEDDPRHHPFQFNTDNNNYGGVDGGSSRYDGVASSPSGSPHHQLPRRRSAFSSMNPAPSPNNNTTTTEWSPPHVTHAGGGMMGGVGSSSPLPHHQQQQRGGAYNDDSSGSPLLVVTSPITSSSRTTNNTNASLLSAPNFRDAFAGNMMGHSLSSSSSSEKGAVVDSGSNVDDEECHYDDGFSLEALCRDSTISSALASKLTTKQRRLFNLLSLAADTTKPPSSTSSSIRRRGKEDAEDSDRNLTLRQLVMEEGYSTSDIQALLSVLLPAQQKQYGKSISAKLLLSASKGHHHNSSVEEEDDALHPMVGGASGGEGGHEEVRASHTLSVPFFYAPYRQTKGEAKTSRLQEISTTTHRPSSVFTSKEYRQKNQPQPQSQSVQHNKSSNVAERTTSGARKTSSTLGSALASRTSVPDGANSGDGGGGKVSATTSTTPGIRHTAASSSSSNHISGATVRRIISKTAPLNINNNNYHPDGNVDEDGDAGEGYPARSSSTKGATRRGTASATPSARKVSVSGKSRWGHGSPLTEVVIAGTF